MSGMMTSNSLSGMLSTLIPSLLVACVLVGAFLILRPKVKRIYSPRSYLGSLSEHERSPKTSDSMFGWIHQFSSTHDDYILNHHSLDAYLFVRFWKLLALLCLIAWPITWIILMPVYGTSHAADVSQFNKISFSHIDAMVDGNRLYAVTFVAWIVLGAFMFLIGRESLFAIRLKQTFHLLPGIASRLASRTVLFTSVPKEYLTEAAIRDVFPQVAGVWFARDTKELDELVEERDKAAMKLETGIIKLSKMANQNKLKAEKKGGVQANEDPQHWVDQKKRPTHKLKFFGLFGKKVDTIDWSHSRLEDLNPKVEKSQAAHFQGQTDPVSAVFIEFTNVAAAEAAFFSTKIGKAGSFKARAIGSRPEEVVWKNLNKPESARLAMTIAAMAIILLMIIFWVPITAFIGALSNINALTGRVHFLSFIDKIPNVILGVVTGLLPTILLAVALILVPIIMRLLFKLAGAVTLSEIELKTQTWYFVFQVIQVFLIVTIASAAASTVTQIISNPSVAPTLLATNLPKASNFYINFFVLYGVAVASKTIFNIVAVVLLYVMGKFLDSTPRKKYNRYIKIAGLSWGSIYPKFTNLGVIAITYSCISPLILGFAAISFILLGIAYRYLILYAYDVTPVNTQGRAYLKALQQLTTGVYLSCICLIGLMAIATAGSTSAAGPLVLMIIFLVAIVIYHILLNMAIKTMEMSIAREHRAFDTLQDGENSSPNSSQSEGVPQRTGEINRKEKIPNSSQSEGVPQRTGEISKREKMAIKQSTMFEKMLRVPDMPKFDQYLSTPIPEYTNEARQEAYLNPSITSPLPLLWIVRDNIGVSDREKESAGRVVATTDQGAWWDEKGKLQTVFTDPSKDHDDNLIREAPIWEEKVHY